MLISQVLPYSLGQMRRQKNSRIESRTPSKVQYSFSLIVSIRTHSLSFFVVDTDQIS